VVDILGKKYDEASQELAATRISAEAIVATVAASEAGKAASAIAEQLAVERGYAHGRRAVPCICNR
jgi:hypothetical protein